MTEYGTIIMTNEIRRINRRTKINSINKKIRWTSSKIFGAIQEDRIPPRPEQTYQYFFPKEKLLD